MLAKLVDIQEAQARFFDLVTLVTGGTEVILIQNKKPVMRLVPITGLTITAPSEASSAEAVVDVAERNAWSFLAQSGLNSAYGDHEPEYTLNMIKEPNLTYAGG